MRYISDLNISFSLLVNGVDKRFSFTPCARGGSMYIAKNKEEIKALEASDMYGRVYRRMEGQAEGEVADTSPTRAGHAAKAPAKVKDVKGVETWQEAVEYLSDKCEREKLTTPEEILAEAARRGIRFPDIH